MKRLLAIILVIVLTAPAALAQQTQDGTVRHRSGARRQLATIVFAGLGGAILGLSTLSFYGRPQEHLSNIAMGFAVGVIGGTAYVTVRSATTREYYEDRPQGLGEVRPIEVSETNSAALTDDTQSLNADKVLWSPLIARASSQSSANVFGGQLFLRF